MHGMQNMPKMYFISFQYLVVTCNFVLCQLLLPVSRLSYHQFLPKCIDLLWKLKIKRCHQLLHFDCHQLSRNAALPHYSPHTRQPAVTWICSWSQEITFFYIIITSHLLLPQHRHITMIQITRYHILSHQIVWHQHHISPITTQHIVTTVSHYWAPDQRTSYDMVMSHQIMPRPILPKIL